MKHISKTVLIVDDSALVRAYYRSILEEIGLQVQEALNGVEALERTTDDGHRSADRRCQHAADEWSGVPAAGATEGRAGGVHSRADRQYAVTRIGFRGRAGGGR